MFCYIEDFQSIKMDALKYLNSNLVAKHQKKRKTWKERVENFEQGWENVRERILETTIGCLKIGHKCLLCSTNTAQIKCHQCPEVELCVQCDRDRHANNNFHNRCAFLEGFKKNLAPTEGVGPDGDIINIRKKEY